MNKKNQRIIHNLFAGKLKTFDIKTRKKTPRFYVYPVRNFYQRPRFYFLLFRTYKKFKIFFTAEENIFKKTRRLFAASRFYKAREKRLYVKLPQLRWLFSGAVIKSGLTILISAAIIYGIVQAGSLTPPSGPPSAKFYTLSEIYNFITNNTPATEGGHDFTFSDSLAGTGHTLAEIYDALANLISADKVKLGTTYLNVAGTLVPSGGTATTADVLSGKTFFGDSQTDWNLQTGTMPNNGVFSLTASSTDQTVAEGYYSGGVLAGDPDLAPENIKSGVDIFGVIGNLVAGYLYGDSDPSKVLTTATGAGTYNAANLDENNVRYGTEFATGLTGALSPYPNTPSGISGLNQSVCTDAGWTWLADSNYDGINDDPICVSDKLGGGYTKLWNMSGTAPYNVNDNTFIGNYGCSGDPDGDGVGTLDSTLSGTVVERDGYGDDANTALAIADCKDGIRNLLTAAYVESIGYTQPNSDSVNGYNGPLSPKALIEWKGTRLPSSNDFFGFCGDGTASTSAGLYGTQIGRTDAISGTTGQGNWEWLSEQSTMTSARAVGVFACSYFTFSTVNNAFKFRAVFRP